MSAVPIASRRSGRFSTKTIILDDEGWESPGELLYPDSDPETASDSTSQSRSSTPTVHPAQGPPVRQVSHARRRSADHVPRPPNSFILFRSDYCVRNKQLDSEAVRDHALVSQLAGKAWRALSPAARKEYEDIAQEKKKEHAEKYPGYTYSPTSRSGGKGKKRKAADDGDYEERARQSKQRTRAQPLRVVVESQGSFSSANSTRKGSCVAPTVRTSASSPELARSQTPELSPNSSSSSESPDPDPVICTPAITHPQDDDFVPTSEIPPLNLYAPTLEEKKDIKIERSQRPSLFYEVGSQFFKAEIPRQSRDMCMWYDIDGSYSAPALTAMNSSADDDALRPINYSQVQFTNPFAASNFELEMEELIHMDRLPSH